MRAGILAGMLALTVPAIAGAADLADTLWTWRGVPETAGAELRLFEVGRDTVGARLRVRYKALALGLPTGAHLAAWSFPLGVERGVCLQTGFQVDSAGRVECPAGSAGATDPCPHCAMPLDQIVLSATDYRIAEPYRLGLVSYDAATAAYAEIFPFPLETRRDSLSLHLEMARPDGMQFVVVGEGYPPGKEVGVTIRSDERSTGYKMSVPADGRFRILVYPQVAGRRSGFASVAIELDKKHLTLDWPWGEGALRRP